MSTLDSNVLLIAEICFSLFFILLIVTLICSLVVLRKIFKKAQKALENVETVTGYIESVGKKATLKSLFKGLGFLLKLSKRL